MADFKVVIKNETESSVGMSENGTPSTSGQQKIEKAKANNKKAEQSKQIGTIALSVASSGLALYSQYSSMQASLEGNSDYSQRVAARNSMLQKGLSVGGSFLMGTAMSGGNVAVGGVTAIISAATSIASEIMEYDALSSANKITRTSTNLASIRLGNANNIWRK